MSDLETIKAMLTYRRPFGSNSEAEYIERFIAPLGVQTDKFGNRFLVVGEERPTILWSSHTDTVHRMDGVQQIRMTGSKIRLAKRERTSNCLGADDAAGNFIMMEMIKARVPGLYVFHYCEEHGCRGSGAIANQTPSFLDGIQAAVAFDRRGFDSVITHQRIRTSSDAFARSMAEQLPARFKPDPTGVLTDTKIYMGIVPECSNISVGYENEHHPTETLCVQHLFELRDHMIKIDASKFTIERDPKAEDTLIAPKALGDRPLRSLATLRLMRRMRRKTLEELVFKFPRQVASFLEDINVSVGELQDAIDIANDDPMDDDEPSLLDIFDENERTVA
ncbi:hypothetical protein [Bradyrhizobium sp. SZCCHNR3118]|uniref:hypothetical protein n=1 Tax=Bradyrhizobium sp. SZCCHNR3118 TaxID=3057468 RepID=UPI0029168F6A|nr:hypothetical protein [Bradyrhizobium sp. SZCCHNR3118]